MMHVQIQKGDYIKATTSHRFTMEKNYKGYQTIHLLIVKFDGVEQIAGDARQSCRLMRRINGGAITTIIALREAISLEEDSCPY